MESLSSRSQWIEHEFRGIDLADRRLNSRFQVICEAMSEKMDNNIASTFDSWKDIKAAPNMKYNLMVQRLKEIRIIV